MSMEDNLFWNFGPAKENLEELQKTQSEFFSRLLNQGAELQKKQFLLLSNIIQNQVEFSSHIFFNALNTINDNTIFTEKKAVKSK